MFYYLNGKVDIIDMTSLVVDCGGVGYLVYASAATIGKASVAQGAMLIYTYVSVREDAFEIYGFADKAELAAFKLLIGVSGIGPKAGLSILSTLSPARLSSAIISGDAKAISAAPGVGKKTAERVILELKDKIGKTFDMPEEESAVVVAQNESAKEKQRDVTDTLLALGYTKGEIGKVLGKIDSEKPLEDMIKDALKFLMK